VGLTTGRASGEAPPPGVALSPGAAGAADAGELVARYLGHLAGERGLARNSVLAYGRDLRRYHEYLTGRGLRSLADVDEATLAAFAAALRGGDKGHQPLAAASVARMLVAVRSLHRFAQREGALVEDVAQPVRLPTPPRRLPKALSVDEVLAVLAAAGGVSPDGDRPAAAAEDLVDLDAAGSADLVRRLRSSALLELLYGTGARISEAVGLDLEDLDLNDTGASVRLRGAGGRDRVVPLGRYAVTSLSAYLGRGRPALQAAESGPAVFLSRRGGRLSRQSAWSALRAAAAAAGLEGVSPHVLRHSFAMHLLDGGADVRVVQELLGHASVRTTQLYTLATADRLREVLAATHPRALDAAEPLSAGMPSGGGLGRGLLPPQPDPDRFEPGPAVAGTAGMPAALRPGRR